MTLSTTNRPYLGGATLAVSLLAGAAASADTIFVSTCGNDAWTGANSFCLGPVGPKRTIQAALDVASDGDEIRVTAGTYSGPVDFHGLAVRLLGLAGPELTTIDGHGTDRVVACDNGEGPDTILEGFTITGGRASSGAGMRCAGTSPTIDDCIFADNSANVSGGGIQIIGGSPVLQACRFVGNTAGAFGGGVFCNGGSPTVNACQFEDNEAQNGGGMYNANGAAPLITWTSFTSNTAWSFGGGGMSNQECSPSLVLCSFIDNTAPSRGGGMYNGDSAVTLEGVFFQANECSDGSGGGAYDFSGSATYTSCAFENNASEFSGGATYNLGSQSRYMECMFAANTSNTGGGAIGHQSGTLLVSGADFTGNATLSYGGAILAQSGQATIANSRFVGGSALLGGAVATTESVNALIVNALLRGNSASAGGAIYDGEEADTRIVNCTVVNNSSAQGGALYADGATQLFNTIVWDNEIVAGVGTPTVAYSAIEGGWAGTGNIDVDPEFIDPGSSNYRLAVTSPCIDSGMNHAVPADAPDLDEDGNHLERMPHDLDAQPRFMDAAVADAGCGASALVDIGAFEVAGAVAGDVVIGDINQDGVVDFADLLSVLEAWGPCGGCCPADLNLDGVVDFSELLVVLSGWGS